MFSIGLDKIKQILIFPNATLLIIWGELLCLFLISPSPTLGKSLVLLAIVIYLVSRYLTMLAFLLRIFSCILRIQWARCGLRRAENPEATTSFVLEMAFLSLQPELILTLKTVALYSWLLLNLWLKAPGLSFFPRKCSEAMYFSSCPSVTDFVYLFVWN